MKRSFLTGIAIVAAIGLFGGCSSTSSGGGGEDTEDLPDLVLTELDPGSTTSVESGQSIGFRYTIRNAADGGGEERSALTAPGVVSAPAVPASPDAGAFKVAFYLSLDQVFESEVDRMVLPVLEVSGLDAGSSDSWVQYVVDVPGDLAATTYYLFGVIDSDEEIAEEDETNNVGPADGAWAITVYDPDDRLPDLYISSGSYQSTMYQGAQTTMNFGWTNIGMVASPTSCNALVYLSEDSVLDPGDELISTPVITVPTIATGEMVYQDVTFTVPGSITGDAYIIIRTDSGDAITEEDENNNNNANMVNISDAI